MIGAGYAIYPWGLESAEMRPKSYREWLYLDRLWRAPRNATAGSPHIGLAAAIRKAMT